MGVDYTAFRSYELQNTLPNCFIQQSLAYLSDRKIQILGNGSLSWGSETNLQLYTTIELTFAYPLYIRYKTFPFVKEIDVT